MAVATAIYDNQLKTTTMAKESIYMMMLQVLDDPTSVRLIVETNYPDFGNTAHNGKAYFMIDRGDCGDELANIEPEVYDDWHVTDSLGQQCTFNSNVELIKFLESIESITVKAWVESF